jgi:hypothetical protein
VASWGAADSRPVVVIVLAPAPAVAAKSTASEVEFAPPDVTLVGGIEGGTVAGTTVGASGGKTFGPELTPESVLADWIFPVAEITPATVMMIRVPIPEIQGTTDVCVVTPLDKLAFKQATCAVLVLSTNVNVAMASWKPNRSLHLRQEVEHGWPLTRSGMVHAIAGNRSV